MKKLLLALITLGMSLSLIACSGGIKEEEKEEEPKQEETEPQEEIPEGRTMYNDLVVLDNDICTITVHYMDLYEEEGYVTPIFNLTITNKTDLPLNYGDIPAKESVTMDMNGLLRDGTLSFELLLVDGNTEVGIGKGENGEEIYGAQELVWCDFSFDEKNPTELKDVYSYLD